MEQLIYISTARSLGALDQSQVDQILETSRRNNSRDGLSGLLVIGGRRFLQLLEGPSEALARTYARIRADERHFALVELSRRSISERSLPEWAMACASDGESLSAAVERLTSLVDDALLRAEFASFAEQQSLAA